MDKIKIDITMTACLRPEIVKKTLQTFSKYLFNDPDFDYRLIINIDETGSNEDCDYHDLIAEEIIQICKQSFSLINYNLRWENMSNFPKAFKWVWDQVDADYVFHLEDDWELLRHVNLKKMIGLMEKYRLLKILRLSAFHAGQDNMKNWNRFYPWNGEFYECPKNLIGGMAFSGHPSLIKSDWIYYVRKYLNGISNPEKQIKWRDRNIGPYIQNFRYGVFSEQNIGPTIVDLGRKWMIKTGWRKKGNKARFTKWIKI